MILTFKTKKSAEVAFAYLTDMQKFVTVHPIIYKIEKIKDNTYLVYETLPILFLPFSFTYTITLASDSQTKTVIIQATVLKINKIKMVFMITGGSDFTTIQEEINFQTPLPVKLLMRRIFKKQHEQLFKNIDSAG